MQRYPLKYLAPNAITCASLTFGLVSVFHSMAGDYRSAAWFILMSVLFDKADGTVARLLRASSQFGIQLDSFSDFVTFGIAPAFLVHAMLTDPVTGGAPFITNPALAWALRVSVVLYVLGSCLRLAKFNVLTERIGSGYFLGIPTTLTGALVASYVATGLEHGWSPVVYQVLPAAFLALSFLMVSNWKLPKLRLPAARPARWTLSLVVASIYVCGMLWLFPAYLLAMAVLFAVGGFTWGALRLRGQPAVPPPDDSGRNQSTVSAET